MTAPVEIAFSFDTTGSMSSCLKEVRNNIAQITTKLFDDVPHVRIGIMAHGDYCDLRTSYATKWHDFVDKSKSDDLVNFVKNVNGTGGGDYPECYELAMRQIRTQFSWQPGSQRALVVIGDAEPHTPEDAQKQGGEAIDWQEELKSLIDMGVRVYSVQCGGNYGGNCSFGAKYPKFFSDLAAVGGGRHLQLATFPTIVDMFMAICFREVGAEFFEAYEKEVHSREGAFIRHELTNMFDALRDDGKDDKMDCGTSSSGYSSISDVSPTPSTSDSTTDRSSATLTSPSSKSTSASPSPSTTPRRSSSHRTAQTPPSFEQLSLDDELTPRARRSLLREGMHLRSNRVLRPAMGTGHVSRRRPVRSRGSRRGPLSRKFAMVLRSRHC